MTAHEVQAQDPEDKDEEIKKLKAKIESYKLEVEWHEKQNEVLGNTAKRFISVAEECLGAFDTLAKSFTELSQASSECSSNLNKYFVAYKRGAGFDPEYVRLQISLMTDVLLSSTDSMGDAVDRIVKAMESAKGTQEELTKAAQNLKGVNE